MGITSRHIVQHIAESKRSNMVKLFSDRKENKLYDLHQGIGKNRGVRTAEIDASAVFIFTPPISWAELLFCYIIKDPPKVSLFLLDLFMYVFDTSDKHRCCYHHGLYHTIVYKMRIVPCIHKFYASPVIVTK